MKKSRKKGDVQLRLGPIRVRFKDKKTAIGVQEGNNAAWSCRCGEPLIGRCYFQFGHDCHTPCEGCGRAYRVYGDDKKKAVEVVEIDPVKKVA